MIERRSDVSGRLLVVILRTIQHRTSFFGFLWIVLVCRDLEMRMNGQEVSEQIVVSKGMFLRPSECWLWRGWEVSAARVEGSF